MGRANFTFNRNVNSNARWQDYITKLHNALVTAGLEHVPVTGELDLGSNKPANNSGIGHRIYKFSADPDKATHPVYVAISPVVSRAADVPVVVIAAAFDADETGLVGNASAGLWSGSYTTQPTDGDATTFISHGDGYLHILNNVSSQTRDNATAIFVERPLTDEGSSKRGLVVGTINGQIAYGTRHHFVPRTGVGPTYGDHTGGAVWGASTPWSQGVSTGFPSWQWIHEGDNQTPLLPIAVFPFFGQVAAMRMVHSIASYMSADQVIDVGPDGNKIQHYWAGDLGPVPGGMGGGWGLGIRYEE